MALVAVEALLVPERVLGGHALSLEDLIMKFRHSICEASRISKDLEQN